MTNLDTLKSLPKILLHDHLDGGLRPQTTIELAAEVGHTLPATDAEQLGKWFFDAGNSGSLPLYLETFDHTTAVMQTEEALFRVAKESALDLADDGVVYAEQRYAPEQHLTRGLSLQQVVEAVQRGFEAGAQEAAAKGQQIKIGTLITAMRHLDRWDEIADLALEYRDAGVVGFDIAGPESGFPPDRHVAAFQKLREANFPATVHAGESEGIDSISAALHRAGALRLGHGFRIVDDIKQSADGKVELGTLARWVMDRQIALELCPTSNTQTTTGMKISNHPITPLRRLGFAVTINTDNRLQSGTTLSNEMALLVDEAAWTLPDLLQATITAAYNAFLPLGDRARLVNEIILPAWQQALVAAQE